MAPVTATPAQRALWSSNDPSKWRAALEAYPAAVQRLEKTSKSGAKLVELDTWYREALPGLIASRAKPHLLQSEVAKVVDWKLTRGKWRPRLLQFASELSPELVKTTTTEALAALPSLARTAKEGALPALTVLKGIGPATASAVLAAAAPEEAPFMSDEAMAAVLPPVPSSSAYTLPRYLQFAEELKNKAAKLNSSLTASDLERSLWATAFLPADDVEITRSEVDTTEKATLPADAPPAKRRKRK